MRRPLPLLLLAGLTSLSSAAHAACDSGLAERMHTKLHPKRPLDHDRAVCEAWRGVPGRFIVVLPLPYPSSDVGHTAFDLDVLVVQQADNGNTDRAKIVSQLFEAGALSEDALRIAEIRVDSARYTLASDAKAFGLRILRQDSSRTNPYSNESLSLYVQRGPKLVKVLDDLEIALERGESDDTCSSSFETVRGNLSVARSGSADGYADLVLRQTRSISRSSPLGEDCVSQTQGPSYQSRLLRYEGTRYRLTKVTVPD